jgi:hypothetical protein
MKNWREEDIGWERFDRARVDPAIVPLIKAAALVERNGRDYAAYLHRVFADDPAFRVATDAWSVEEVRHGDVLGRWAMLADPGWDFEAASASFRAGYQVPGGGTDGSVRGSRSGELIARCVVETGTSSYYTALAAAAAEPVLVQICKYIAGDELRHFKLFYTHLRLYLAREDISFLGRLRIAARRVGESEDDELAFAYHCANEPLTLAYDRARCASAYLRGALGVYRFPHVERGMGMVFKTVGLPPRGRLSDWSAHVAWFFLRRRSARLARQVPLAQAA